MKAVSMIADGISQYDIQGKTIAYNEVRRINMQTIIKVEGMMCTHCKARVEATCKAVSGVTDAVVDLKQKQVAVSGTASEDALKKAITDAGYEVIG